MYAVLNTAILALKCRRGASTPSLTMIPNRLKADALAGELFVSRNRVYNVVKQRGSVDEELAEKLAQRFDTSVEFWLNLQHQYDETRTPVTVELCAKVGDGLNR